MVLLNVAWNLVSRARVAVCGLPGGGGSKRRRHIARAEDIYIGNVNLGMCFTLLWFLNPVFGSKCMCFPFCSKISKL